MGRQRPRGRSRPLAGGSRVALPGAPPIPGAAAERADFRATHFDHDPSAPVRGDRGTRVEPARGRGPGASSGSSCPTAVPTPFDSVASASSGCRSRTASSASRSSGWPVTRAGCSSRSATRRTATRPTAPVATWWTRPSRPTSAQTSRPATSSWTSTSRPSRRAPSIHDGRARWLRPRTASPSRFAPASGWSSRARLTRTFSCRNRPPTGARAVRATHTHVVAPEGRPGIPFDPKTRLSVAPTQGGMGGAATRTNVPPGPGLPGEARSDGRPR